MAAIGSASAEIWLPNWLIVWPAQSLRRSACRHRPPRGQRVFSLRAMEALSVSVRRGGTVEARHCVHAVAVRDGEVVAAAGDPQLVCLFRSSAKPIQALLLARARPDLDDTEVAIACASHRAEPAQITQFAACSRRLPATEPDLECGEQEGRARGAIHHNCSGKHAGFLAVCRARGWENAGYRLVEHPLQRALHEEVAGAAEATEMATAVDGCGVLTFALSLERMAAWFFSVFVRSTAPRGSSPRCARIPSSWAAKARSTPTSCAGSPAGWRRAAPKGCCARSRPTERDMPSSPRTAVSDRCVPRSRAFSTSISVAFPSSARVGKTVGEVVVE